MTDFPPLMNALLNDMIGRATAPFLRTSLSPVQCDRLVEAFNISTMTEDSTPFQDAVRAVASNFVRMRVHQWRHLFDDIAGHEITDLEPYTQELTDRVLDTEEFADLLEKACRNTEVMASVPMSVLVDGPEFVFITDFQTLFGAMFCVLGSEHVMISGASFLSQDILIRSELDHDLLDPVQFALKTQEEAQHILKLADDNAETLVLGGLFVLDTGEPR